MQRLLLLGLCSVLFVDGNVLRARLNYHKRTLERRQPMRMERLPSARAKKSDPFNKVTGSGTLTDLDHDDYWRTIEFSFGTPPQVLSLRFDMQTSNTWVVDKACVSDDCNGFPDFYTRTKYDALASSTFINDSQTFLYNTDVYGDLYGYYGEDKITFGGGLTIEKQKFGSVLAVRKSTLAVDEVDGVLGMAWPSIALDDVVPPMQNILSQLDLPLFTLWIPRGVDGEITFGGYDTVHCSSTIGWIPLSSLSYWQFQIDGMSIGSYSLKRNMQAMIVSSFYDFGVPSTYLEAIARSLGAVYDDNEDVYSLPCDDDLPDLKFVINGNTYVVSADELFTQYEDPMLADQCSLNFFSMGTSGGFAPAWFLPGSFLHGRCGIFDIGNQQIGFTGFTSSA